MLKAVQINLNVWTHLVIHLIKPSKQRWCSYTQPPVHQGIDFTNLQDALPSIVHY